MINITYLILAHDGPDRLARLVSVLRSKTSRFVIHIDSLTAVDDFLTKFAEDEQVKIIDNRCNSRWGTYGLVQATLNGMEFIVDHMPQTDRIVLLSGKDYPIKPVHHIESFFAENRDSIFIEYFTVPYEKWYNNGESRFPNFKEIDQTMKIYGGSQWWSFPLKVTRFILEFLNYNPDFQAYFKMVTIPDESFFQTLLHNCGEAAIAEHIVCDNLRIVKWDPPFIHPRTLTLKDVNLIMESNCLFARKFDGGADDGILDLIDREILKIAYNCDQTSSTKIIPEKSIRQSVAFLTNKTDFAVAEEFRNLERQVGDQGDVKMLFHQSVETNANCCPGGSAVFLFNDDIFDELGYRTFLDSKLDGSNHFPLIKFFRQNPDYDFYWYIEDDVRCLQGWDRFFSYFLENRINTDFLSCHIRDFQDEPDWYWWNSLNSQCDPVAMDLVRSFNPIFRISKLALTFIDKSHLDGYSGHFEVLLPSLLKSAGFTIAEFGGKGKYVLPGCENFFYKAADADATGNMMSGSMRYRPIVGESEMIEPFIYHPVKGNVSKGSGHRKMLTETVELSQEKVTGFSVIMPTYNQCHFIRRAILSLLSQSYEHWELIIINDGCTDHTDLFLDEFIHHQKITYIKNIRNQGLGYALNQGLEAAKYNYIAYLPSDDFYYKEHLYLLSKEFKKYEDTILVYTRARSEIIDSFGEQRIEKTETDGIFNGYGIQLVQAAHKLGGDRWVTRDDFVTSSLSDMFWNKLIDRGDVSYIPEFTCNWTIHPLQRHKFINITQGGSIHKYKHHYKVEQPIKIALGKGRFLNEVEEYENFRQPLSPKRQHLKILVVGELSYNYDRIYALEQKGHKLYGLWANDAPSWSHTGPLPFGNVVNISNEDWASQVREIKPDIIYAVLNHGGVNLAYEVLSKCLNIPFVWHFKEGPSVCIREGSWQKLIELYHKSDGKIFINPEAKAWYSQFIPLGTDDLTHIMDGDQPKFDYFTDQFSTKLSAADGQIHTVVVGRMIGISLEIIEQLSSRNIHIHAYSGGSSKFNSEATEIAPGHFHVHPFIHAKYWSKELSKYDAGWLHCTASQNGGDLLLATWDDLNLPCRIGTYAAAELPMIHPRNDGHIVAAGNYINEKKVGVFFDSIDDLALRLHDVDLMNGLNENIRKAKPTFSFDYHVDELIAFFKKVITKKRTSF